MKIYCAHPINGLELKDIVLYYTHIKNKMEEIGLKVFHPMLAEDSIRTKTSDRATSLKPDILNNPSTNHAIVERDKWYVQNCNIFYADLLGSKVISIGTIMELAWASLLGKYTIVLLDKDSVYKHAFVLEAADIVFDNEKKALEYIKRLVN